MLVICFSDNRFVLVNQSRNKAWTKIKSSVNAYYRTQCHWRILLAKPLHVVREIAIGCPAVSCSVLWCVLWCPVVSCGVLPLLRCPVVSCGLRCPAVSCGFQTCRVRPACGCGQWRPWWVTVLPRGLCCHAVFVCVSVCVCACLCVMFVIKTSNHIFKFFSPSGSHTILVYDNIPTGTPPPITGSSNAGGRVGSDSEPISGFTACCQRCNQLGVINTPPDHGPASCDACHA